MYWVRDVCVIERGLVFKRERVCKRECVYMLERDRESESVCVRGGVCV